MSDTESESGGFHFQAFSWTVDDGTVQGDDDYDNMDFTVRIFGKTRNGESVAVHVSGFNPSFCVSFPEHASSVEWYDQLEELLRKELKIWDFSSGQAEEVADLGEHLLLLDDCEKVIYRKSLWGFSNGAKRPFFRFAFRSRPAHDKLKNLFRACHKNCLSEEEMEEFHADVVSLKKAAGRDWASAREQVDELVKNTSLDTGIPERVLRWIVKLGNAELPFAFAKGKLFEVIDPILRFAHLRDLRMAGWVILNNPRPVQTRLTTCALEFDSTYEELSSKKSDDICPKIKEMAFDIEAYSHDDQFPDPFVPENCAFQIALTFKEYANPNIRRMLLHLRSPEQLRGTETGRCGLIADAEVINFEKETDLLRHFAKIVVDEDPDIMYGYNSDSFDWNYLMVRAQVLGCSDALSRISRLRDYVCKVETSSFQSSAYGDNKYLRVDVPGRLNIDLMIWIQRNMPPDRYTSYALDTVAELEIGQNKHDVNYKEIFRAFRTGNEAKCTEVGDYCCQDAVLVQRLAIKLDTLTQMFEMSNITDTPPMYLLQKGQQIKVFSQITKKAMEKGFLVPLPEERENGSFTGAIVLEPDIGQYLTPVAVLDFASLYPSIQVAYQVCYSTIVLIQCRNCKTGQEPCLRSRGHECMDNLPGVEYVTIEWDDEVYVFREKSSGKKMTFKSLDDAKVVAPKKKIEASIRQNDNNDDAYWRKEKIHHRFRFAQRQPSVIPDLQIELKKSRKAVRKLMGPIEHSKDPDDQLRYRVLNGRQLAIKVSMNSIYGFTSAFMLNLQALSAAVTAKGRQMIEQTRDFMESRFESIARDHLWTMEDVRAHYDKAGREVSGDVPEEGWIRKFPTAVAGLPWTERDLRIHVVGGDTVSLVYS
jgi:DNA polymerase elongation subunit (family B)